MRKTITALGLGLALMLAACGQLEPWEMPQVDAAPTPSPTPSPRASSAAEIYIWNEALAYDMASPGVTVERFPSSLSHKESLALFGQDLLPTPIFSESRSSYSARYLQRTEHDVILDGQGELAENAYVEYVYLPSNGDEDRAIRVMAELCSHETALSILQQGYHPHVSLEEGAALADSRYYLESFWLFKVGQLRYAQALVLPEGYLSLAQQALELLEEGEELPRQALLSFTCGEDVSDEEFIAAVCRIWQYGQGIDPVPREEEPSLPAPGEKGAA